MAAAGSAASMPVWLREIGRQLDRRDATQYRSLAILIDTYNEAAKATRQLETRAATLETENAFLKDKTDTLQRAVNAAGKPGGANPKELEDLKQSNADLTRRLLDATTRENQAHLKLVDLNDQLRRKEDECKRREENEIKYHDQLLSLERQVRDLQEANNNSEVTNQVLHDELQALQLELISREERMKEVEAENNRLLERWLKKMNEEANAQNRVMEDDLSRRGLGFCPRAAQLAQGGGGAAPTLADAKIDPALDLVANPRGFRVPVGTSVIPTNPRKKLIAHENEINAVQASHNGSLFATGSADHKVKVFDSQGTIKQTMRGANLGIMCVQFSKNDELIMAGANDNATRIWAVDTGRLKTTFTGHIGKVFAARFTGDSSKAITGSHDRTLKVWDLNRNFCVRTIFSYSSCNDLCILDDSGELRGWLSSNVASGHLDFHVRFWDSRNGDCVNDVSGIHSGQVTSLNLSPNNTELLTNSRDNTIKLLDVRMLQVIHTFSAENYRAGMNWTKSSFSPDGEYIVAGSADGAIYVWNRRTTKLEKTLRAHTGAVAGVSWNPNGMQMYSVDKDKTVVIWEAE